VTGAQVRLRQHSTALQEGASETVAGMPACWCRHVLTKLGSMAEADLWRAEGTRGGTAGHAGIDHGQRQLLAGFVVGPAGGRQATMSSG
jgi:hypothetical protein